MKFTKILDFTRKLRFHSHAKNRREIYEDSNNFYGALDIFFSLLSLRPRIRIQLIAVDLLGNRNDIKLDFP